MSKISIKSAGFASMFRSAVCRLTAPGRFGFRSERRGTTALEFAILSVPFMLFLLFLFEIGLDLYVQLALDYAVQEGARELQTGAGNSALSVNTFQTDCLCPKVAGFLNCNQIILNIAPMTSADYYTNAVAGAGSIPVSANGLDTSSFAFIPSGPDTPMFMQAIYTSVSAVGLLLPIMSVKYGSSRVHVTNSTIGFVNEPFSSSNSVCGAAQ